MLGLLVCPVFAIAATTLAGAVVYYTYPSVLITLYFRISMFYAGLRIKYVEGNNFKFCYAERGKRSRKKPTLLMLHGFSAGKDNWSPIYGKIPSDIHIIAMDLPGHGDTSVPSLDDDISIGGFISKIEQFVKLVGLDEQPFHILGQSLGGQIAALYAAKNPQLIERVTLMCPAMKAPEESSFEKKMKDVLEDQSGDLINTTHCPLIPETTEEIENMMQFVIHNPKPPPKQILKALLDLRKPYLAFYLRMFKELTNLSYPTLVQENAHKIQAPVQVIWGRNDQVVDVSAIETLKKVLPNLQQVDIFDNCGHSVNYEKPSELVNAVLKFRGDQKKVKGN